MEAKYPLVYMQAISRVITIPGKWEWIGMESRNKNNQWKIEKAHYIT